MRASTPEAPLRAPPRPATALVSDLIRAWPPEDPFSARRILNDHPDWSRRPSLVLDLACEEFVRRTAAGEPLAIADFVRDYPDHARPLRRLIEIDQSFASRGTACLWPCEGEEIARFQLLEPLGRGAQSRVFLAEELSLDSRRVVLKFVPHGSPEAVLQARTQHPHVMSVHSVVDLPDRGLAGICMPYVGRATLCDLIDVSAHVPIGRRTTAHVVQECIDAGWLDPAHANVQSLLRSREHLVEWMLRIAAALAEALAQAHARGVAHRDLKPSNVLLTFAAEPVLLDFNLAAAPELVSNEGGTVPYMPPERLRGWQCDDPADAAVDPLSADVFSFGAMLFEALTGELPYGAPAPGAASRQELVASMLERQQCSPISPSQAIPRVNGSLAGLIAATLKPDPRDRPASMAAVAEALRRELGGIRKQLRLVRRHPMRSIAAAVTASALLAGLAVAASPIAGEFRGRSYSAAHVDGRSLLPQEVDDIIRAGLADLEAARPGEALVQFEQAMRARPKDGRLAALAAVAALRERPQSTQAFLYLKQADDLGHDSIEHQNNWGVYELRTGAVDSARERLTLLIQTARTRCCQQ